MNKTDRLFIKASPAEKATFEEAAAREGLSLSAWVRMTLLKAARKPKNND